MKVMQSLNTEYEIKPCTHTPVFAGSALESADSGADGTVGPYLNRQRPAHMKGPQKSNLCKKCMS